MSEIDIGDFEEHTLELGEDYEGRVIATLVVSPNNEPGRPSVLYIHGLSDYFFQSHLAAEFNKRGYNFYALDLRKHGRSLLDHQHPNYCRSITEYYQEMDRALDIISTEHKSEIVLFGHSTGGLACSMYMNEGKNKSLVQKLILNSPFLQFNLPFWKRILILPITGLVSYFFPYASLKKRLGHLYGASISNKKRGDWEYNTEWKPLTGFPAYLKWVHAMYKAQKKVHRSSHIKKPILILHSSKSSRNSTWNEEIKKTDMVLDVDHMKKYGKKLGPDVHLEEIPNAIHDIFLSSEKVRKQAFQKMFGWLNHQ